MKLRIEVTILALMTLVLSACSLRSSPRAATQVPATATTAAPAEATSPALDAPTAEAYPPAIATVTEAYPDPTEVTRRTDAFRLEKPLEPGQTTVRGSGPPGVPILIVDVTFMGDVLGQGTIGPDGTFEIGVLPLPADHRIGLALGELGGTEWTVDSFSDVAYHGDEAMLIPQVGFLYDSAFVRS